MPAYTLFDAAASYDFSVLNSALAGVNFTVDATNLADKTYIASCIRKDRCYFGIGRTVFARLNYKW